MSDALQKKVRIIVDNREVPSGIPALLDSRGLTLEFRNLTVGDYILSDTHAVERKTAHDFVSSLIDGRLFDQTFRLSQAYKNAMLLVEGDFLEAFRHFKNPRALWGALAAISLRYNVKPFFTENVSDSASLLFALGVQAQVRSGRGPVVRSKPKLGDSSEQQLAMICSLPGIGPKTAEKLLQKFGSVRQILCVEPRQLSPILGATKAERISELLNHKYQLAKTKRTLQTQIDTE